MENKDLQNEIVNAAAEKAAAATNEALETKTNEISEQLETKASAEDMQKLAKSIDEVKEIATKNFNIGAPKRSATEEMYKAMTDGIQNLKKGEIFELNTKDFVAAEGDDNYQIYREDRVDAIAYDPNYANRLRNVLPSGQTNSGAIRYNVEQSAGSGSNDTNDASAAKTKGSAQAQSRVNIKNIHEPVVTLANVLTLPEEWLNDTPMMESYLSTRLVANLMDLEDEQILTGNGTSPNMSGITNQDRAAFADADARETFIGSLADSRASGGANNFDALVAAAAGLQGENYKPNLVILHPTDYASLFLAQSSGGGYAIAQVPGLGGASSTPSFTVAGIRVISHASQTAGTFTLMDTQYVNYWMNGGMTFSFGYNDTDFGSYEITARAIQRGALTVSRPDGVLTDTFANFITAVES